MPPGWLTKERGVDRTNTVSPKVVVLSVAGLAVLLVAMGLVVALLAGTADERFVDLDEVELDRPTFPDQDMFVDAAPVLVLPPPLTSAP